MRIFSWIKLSWCSSLMWDKSEWLKWFWQFPCEGLSSLNLNRFCYSYTWSCSLCKEGISLWMWFIFGKLWELLFVFLAGFTSFCTLLFSLYLSPPSCYFIYFINPSANKFIYQEISHNFKDWLTYSSRADRPGD